MQEQGIDMIPDIGTNQNPKAKQPPTNAEQPDLGQNKLDVLTSLIDDVRNDVITGNSKKLKRKI